MRPALLIVALGALPAFAHDVMGTVVLVDLGRDRVHLEFEVPMDELRLALGFPSQPGVVPLPAPEAVLGEYVLGHVAVVTPGERAFTLEGRPDGVVEHDARNWLRVSIDARPPEGESARDFFIDTDVVTHRVVSHRIFVFLRHDLETGLVGETSSFVDTLHYQHQRAHVQRAPGSLGHGLGAVFRLGVTHIATGSDHLLFLLTLLLPAGLAVGAARRWGARRARRESVLQLARIVTAFTLGHSLTLLLGALGWAHLPSRWVESLIAVSILVTAAHALVPLFPRREAWVALAFGLVHGLGFASALEGLGVDGSTLVLTVLGFNLGIEVMQAMVVLATLPWVFMLQGTRLGVPLRIGGAVVAGVLALAWLAQRAFGLETPLPAFGDAVMARGPWLLALLATTAVITRRYSASGSSSGSGSLGVSPSGSGGSSCAMRSMVLPPTCTSSRS
jgi:HupE / UreJ protein